MKKFILIVTSLCLFVSVPSFALTELEKTEESLTYFNYFLTQAENAKIKNDEAILPLKQKVYKALLAAGALAIVTGALEFSIHKFKPKAAARIRATTPYSIALLVGLLGIGIYQTSKLIQSDFNATFSVKKETSSEKRLYEKIMKACLEGIACEWEGDHVKEDKKRYKELMVEFFNSHQENSDQDYEIIIERKELRSLIENLKNIILNLKLKKDILNSNL